MRTMKFCFLLFSIYLFTGLNGQAQPFQNAGDYLEYIGNANQKLTAIYLSYTSAVSHGKSARKVEKRRQEVINAIYDTRVSIQNLPPWQGDKSFRDTTVVYLKLLNSVFNEDYGKIVDMEEIAEQSYDAMEAYILAQQKADEKLQQAIDQQNDTERKFAEKNHITLVHTESELGQKSKQASEVMKHHNEVYLIFFKASKQDMYLTDAVNKKNIIAIEENKNSLERFANEGLEKLKDVHSYNNDPSMINACRQALLFFKSEVVQTPVITDFFLKEESFSKLKKN